MDSERWRRVEQLCHAALERGQDQQAAFLESACAGDHALRQEVESLLAHRMQAERFIEAPAFEMAAEALAQDESRRPPEVSRWIGRVLSDYRIVDKVGSGGMGEIYKAVRSDGAYEKQVAIKLVQSGLGTDYFLACFRNERQILASLDHPNIAKLIDGGSTEEGLPYVVMEYIEGQRIDEYCEQRQLDIPERLNLFRAVCSALQYAHKNLVVHRDLKPGNILVTQEGVPKLLDFGIAKILHPQQDSRETRTVTLLPLLTPDYASPEQVRNEAITTSSDVYSLGVILYVLLTRHHPYKSERTGPHDLIRAICEKEPKKPSAVVAQHQPSDSKNIPSYALPPMARSGQSKKLRRALAGDLDNIVLKALRKKPERRYASVEQFSEDIRRYSLRLPVIAHKDTVPYRARKFVSRNKLGVGAAALVILSLLAGLITTLREARIARLERARAERRFNDVRALANSLMFEVHDSIRSLPGATSARKLILQRAQEYLDRLAPEAQSDPSLLRELANAYVRLGNVLGNTLDANMGSTEQALQDYRRATELRKAVVAASPTPDSRRELAESYMTLASVLSQNSKGSTDEDFLGEALSILGSLAASDPEDLKIQYALAKGCERRGQDLAFVGKLQEAKDYYEKSLKLYQHLAEVDPGESKYIIEVGFAHKHLGGALILQNELQAALEEYRASLSIDEAQIKTDPRNANARYAATYTYSDIGFIMGKQGDVDGALSYYRKAFDIRSELAASDPQDSRARAGLAGTYNYIAHLLWQKGDLAGALEDEKQALSIRQALSQIDPTNESKQLNVAFSEGSVGETYVKMAFRPHTTEQRQLALCGKAEFWLQKALPELQQRKNLLGGDADYPAIVQQAIDRCKAIIFQKR